MNQLRQIEEQITSYEAEVARLKTEAAVEDDTILESDLMYWVAIA